MCVVASHTVRLYPGSEVPLYPGGEAIEESPVDRIIFPLIRHVVQHRIRRWVDIAKDGVAVVCGGV